MYLLSEKSSYESSPGVVLFVQFFTLSGSIVSVPVPVVERHRASPTDTTTVSLVPPGPVLTLSPRPENGEDRRIVHLRLVAQCASVIHPDPSHHKSSPTKPDQTGQVRRAFDKHLFAPETEGVSDNPDKRTVGGCSSRTEYGRGRLFTHTIFFSYNCSSRTPSLGTYVPTLGDLTSRVLVYPTPVLRLRYTGFYPVPRTPKVLDLRDTENLFEGKGSTDLDIPVVSLVNRFFSEKKVVTSFTLDPTSTNKVSHLLPSEKDDLLTKESSKYCFL